MKRKFKIDGNTIFLFAWIIACSFNLFIKKSELYYLNNWSMIDKLLSLFVIFLLCCKIFTFDYKFKKRTFLFLILLVLIICIVVVRSSLLILAIQMFFIIASHNVDFKRIIKTDVTIRIFGTLLLFILSVSGIINNYTDYFYDGNVIKYAFGWMHPNMFGASIFLIFTELLYLRWNSKKNIGLFIIFIMGIIFLFKYCQSRTQLYVFIAILFIAMLLKFMPDLINNRIVKKAFLFTAPICVFISYLLVFLYNSGSSIAIQANKLFTGRIHYSAYFLETYGLRLFGSKLLLISTRSSLLTGKKALILDMSYIKLAIAYGIILFVLFIILYMLTEKKLILQKKIPEIIFITYFLIVGIASASMLEVFTNPTFFMLWDIESDKGKKNKEEL